MPHRSALQLLARLRDSIASFVKPIRGVWPARGGMSTVRLIGLACLLRGKELAGRRRGRLFRVPVEYDALAFDVWVGEFRDLEIIREVVVAEQYRLPDGTASRTFLDLGANSGVATLWFNARYPGAVIHAVEPDRVSLERLRANVGHLPNVTIHPVAVGGTDGPRMFYEDTRRGWASSLTKRPPSSRGALVEVVTLPTLLRDRIGLEKVDVIKLDVEGAEWEVFDATAIMDFADVVVGELHRIDDLSEPAMLEVLRRAFADVDLTVERTTTAAGSQLTALRDGQADFLAVAAGMSRGSSGRGSVCQQEPPEPGSSARRTAPSARRSSAS